jgi:hypothetical protein
MEKTVLAICGLDCAACPAFHASEKLSMEERRKVADQWSKEYHAEFKAEDVDCVGCIVKDGKHIGYCSMCELRLCGLGKGYATCADCPDFACAKLEAFHANAPQARANLAAVRAR